MKVNMTPNPLDVVTIHASQGDTEARQWEFELHNNGELIDTSEVTEQMVFKSYKGGTEQLLPENTSTPTTSPFLGDIRYPQGLLTDQEFTYRQSPTESDGLAKITDIKGNTLVWNQLVQNGNFADTSKWNHSDQYVSSFTVSNNEAKIVANANYAQINQNNFSVIAGHKYFCSLTAKCSNGRRIGMSVSGSGMSFDYEDMTSNYAVINKIKTAVNNSTNFFTVAVSGSQNGDEIYVKNIMIHDLTAMGLDSITSVDEFTALFPLSFYPYTQGELISFNGNGIKTVGKNLIKPYPHSGTLSGVDYTFTEDGTLTAFGAATSTSSQFILIDGRITNIVRGAYYFLSGGDDKIRLRITTFDSSGNVVRRSNTSSTSGNLRFMFNDEEVEFYVSASALSTGVNINSTLYPQLELSYDMTSFEPYTESVLSLPISTYFPNGMKSAGSVYDELTPRKAITRIGAVDLGSLAWSYNEQYQCFITYPVLTDSANIDAASVPNFKSIYKAVSWGVGATDVAQDMIVCFISSANQLRTRNKNFTDATAFKSAMSGVYLYYELATPTETSFTTASLVTENAEIPLSNEDGVLIGKCTEQLSENPGFIDAKIKLSDADGECYSNKIQLHVERSPQ